MRGTKLTHWEVINCKKFRQTLKNWQFREILMHFWVPLLRHLWFLHLMQIFCLLKTNSRWTVHHRKSRRVPSHDCHHTIVNFGLLAWWYYSLSSLTLDDYCSPNWEESELLYSSCIVCTVCILSYQEFAGPPCSKVVELLAHQFALSELTF